MCMHTYSSWLAAKATARVAAVCPCTSSCSCKQHDDDTAAAINVLVRFEGRWMAGLSQEVEAAECGTPQVSHNACTRPDPCRAAPLRCSLWTHMDASTEQLHAASLALTGVLQVAAAASRSVCVSEATLQSADARHVLALVWQVTIVLDSAVLHRYSVTGFKHHR